LFTETATLFVHSLFENSKNFIEYNSFSIGLKDSFTAVGKFSRKIYDFSDRQS